MFFHTNCSFIIIIIESHSIFNSTIRLLILIKLKVNVISLFIFMFLIKLMPKKLCLLLSLKKKLKKNCVLGKYNSILFVNYFKKLN